MKYPKYLMVFILFLCIPLIAVAEEYLCITEQASGFKYELYLKVVFKGKGGVSTGRLLAAVNRPH